jgi:tetratricopeptide (TPR) repeat protein
MRGAGLERQKRFDQSEAAFRKVLELDPKNAGALNYLGYMLADRNVRLEEAYDLIKRAVDLEPENGAYLDSLGWVYYRQGKLDDARGLLERALDRMQDPTVHDHLGDVYLKLGKTKEAIAQWQASIHEFQKAALPEADPEEMASVNRKLDEAQAKLAAENARQVGGARTPAKCRRSAGGVWHLVALSVERRSRTHRWQRRPALPFFYGLLAVPSGHQAAGMSAST